MPVDNVKAKNFYKDNGDKIKLNWCLYEYSNVLYTKIAKSPQPVRYRKLHSKDNIVNFCVYFSKRLKKSLFEMQTGCKNNIVFDGKYVYEFYPDNSYAMTQKLLDRL